MMQPVLTIFTPTYNRAELLPRLFESIRQQVLPGDPVEWLVIDDGSRDNTPEVLTAFSAERPDLVRHQRVVNGGKHRAINRAALEAQGDWIFIVDSDDLVAPGAIGHIRNLLAAADEDARIGLLRGLRRFPELELSEPHFSVPRNPGFHAEWVSRQRIFDTAEVLRKSALRMYPFPEYANERFMAESWLWHNLDKTHLTRFVDHVWVDCFYQAGGLSAQSRTIRADCPLSAMDVYLAAYQSKGKWPVRSRAAINWWRYWFHARRRAGSSGYRPVHVSPWLAPAGWFLSRHDRRAER